MRSALFLLLFPLAVHGQIVETIAGKGTAGYSGDNGPADSAELSGPISVRFDHSGNMYIVDQNNNVIRKVDLAGTITTIAGTGTAGYSGDNGLATIAELNSPNDVAFDAEDNLYITDWVNQVIRKVNTSGIITTIAGVNISGIGINGYNGDNIPATSAQLNEPLGMAFDSVGNLYFSDNNNRRVRKISYTGTITTIVGDAAAGFSGDGGLADTAKIRLPGFISFNPSGDLYIGDYINHRIRAINSSGIINTVAGNGIITYTDGGLADTSALEFPWCITFDDSGNYFITDAYNGTIHKVNTTGIITTVAGNGTAGYYGDGGPAIDAEFGFQAACTAVDPHGNLYVADYQNNRIRRIVYNPTNLYTAANNITNQTKQVALYPNPATTEITVTTKELRSVVIVNIIGEAVYEHSFTGSRAVIDVSYLPRGVYFVKVNGSDVKEMVKE